MTWLRLKTFFWVLLYPASFLWAGIARLRARWWRSQPSYRSRIPVICVGNLHSGGSGKSPLVAEIAFHLSRCQPLIVSRGYRGQSRGTQKVDLGREEGAAYYGDEPWMLAHLTQRPVYVGRSRVESLKEIEEGHPEGVAVLDDGFQHFALKRDVDLVVINAERSLEDAHCLPWGDLREPLSALGRAQAVLLTYKREGDTLFEWENYLKDRIPFFRCQRRVVGLKEGGRPVSVDPRDRWVAFSGIAHPERFQRDLAELGEVAFFQPYSDHHCYRPADLDALVRERKRHGATYIVTTDKDWFKLAPKFEARGERLVSLRVGYAIPQKFWPFLKEQCSQLRFEP